MKKGIVSIVSIILCMTLIFAGCDSSEKATDANVNDEANATTEQSGIAENSWESEEITLTFSNYYLEENVDGHSIAFNEAIKRYREDYPNVELVIDATPHDNYLTKIKTLAASNSLPDVFVANGSMIQSFVAGDLMMPLNDILKADSGWTDGFIDGSFEEFTIEDNVYGLPIAYFATHVIYYNTKIFEECGIDEFPSTWTGFIEMINTIKEQGYTPIALGNKAQYVIESFFFSTLADRYTGTDWFYNIKNMTGEAAFTDEEFVSALQTLKDLTDIGTFNSDAQSIDETNQLQYYANGEAAMTVAGAWVFGSLKTMASDDVLEATEVAILPGGMDGQIGDSNATSGGSGWAHGINANLSGAKLEAAIELLKYLHCAETAVVQLQAGSQPSYEFDSSNVELDPLLIKYYAMAENLTFTPIYDIQLDAALVDVLYTGLQELMIGQTTPEELAVKLQEEMEKLK